MRRSYRQRHAVKPIDLQLTSLLDILVIILVFLLKTFSASTHNFSAVPGLTLPVSRSLDVPPDSLHLAVTVDGIVFENERVVNFTRTADDVGSSDGSSRYTFNTADLDEGGRRIMPLYDALVKAREKAEALRAKSSARDASGEPLKFEGILALQADKKVDYDILRKVMYTSGAAGYQLVRFLATPKE